jgi:hypothetical protein
MNKPPVKVQSKKAKQYASKPVKKTEKKSGKGY